MLIDIGTIPMLYPGNSSGWAVNRPVNSLIVTVMTFNKWHSDTMFVYTLAVNCLMTIFCTNNLWRQSFDRWLPAVKPQHNWRSGCPDGWLSRRRNSDTDAIVGEVSAAICGTHLELNRILMRNVSRSKYSTFQNQHPPPVWPNEAL